MTKPLPFTELSLRRAISAAEKGRPYGYGDQARRHNIDRQRCG